MRRQVRKNRGIKNAASKISGKAMAAVASNVAGPRTKTLKRNPSIAPAIVLTIRKIIMTPLLKAQTQAPLAPYSIPRSRFMGNFGQKEIAAAPLAGYALTCIFRIAVECIQHPT
jgi:hypothetical protein